MWEIIKDIFAKRACRHEWELHQRTHINFHDHFIYICHKCGKIKHIKI